MAGCAKPRSTWTRVASYALLLCLIAWVGPLRAARADEPPPDAASVADVGRMEAPRPLPRTEPRHVGLHLGITPSLMLDVQWRQLYAFVNGAILWPALFQSGVMFSGGLGATFRLAPATGWHFDVFAFETTLIYARPWRTPVDEGVARLGVGLGIGFHYTANNGLTLGFKAPLFAVGIDVDRRGKALGWEGSLVYLDLAMYMPLVDIGYRF